MPLTVCTTVSNPRRSAQGPTRPKADSETYTMPGRSSARSSGDNPRRASVPGRYPCENTSASRMSSRSVSKSVFSRRSRCAESLPCPVSNS